MTISRGELQPWLKAALAALLLSVCLAKPARAFPGLVLGKDAAPRFVHTAHVVVMVHDGVFVVTVMADYEGPLSGFALVLPVPRGVRLKDVRTIKREFVSRVEQVSAPRFHTFYEKNPCQPGKAEQQWDEHIAAKGRGFLTPMMLPPADQHYKVSNELSIPAEPVFKGEENEFSYHLVPGKKAASALDWLAGHGYRISPGAAKRLTDDLDEGRDLLVAEVQVDHVELVGKKRIQLGGIRYWWRKPADPGSTASDWVTIASGLGLENARGDQDLFVYVLYRHRRYEAKNYQNVFLPSNVALDVDAGSRVGPIYNALYDRLRAKKPAAIANEFVWTTAGCGEPCANAPLQLRELMSLGGDVLEAETTSRAERLPDPGELSDGEQEELERELAALKPAERPRARRDFAALRRELAQRRALISRQKYVLSRLHYRYDRATLTDDPIFGPAPGHLQGGVGIPARADAKLPTLTEPAKTSRWQMRFVAAVPWSLPISCTKPLRFRWGKPDRTLGRTWRKVFLAQDLPRLPRDQKLLVQSLRTPIPELGLGVQQDAAASAPASVPSDPTEPSCRIGRGETRYSLARLVCLLLLAGVFVRRRPFLPLLGRIGGISTKKRLELRQHLVAAIRKLVA